MDYFFYVSIFICLLSLLWVIYALWHTHVSITNRIHALIKEGHHLMQGGEILFYYTTVLNKGGMLIYKRDRFEQSQSMITQGNCKQKDFDKFNSAYNLKRIAGLAKVKALKLGMGYSSFFIDSTPHKINFGNSLLIAVEIEIQNSMKDLEQFINNYKCKHPIALFILLEAECLGLRVDKNPIIIEYNASTLILYATQNQRLDLIAYLHANHPTIKKIMDDLQILEIEVHKINGNSTDKINDFELTIEVLEQNLKDTSKIK